MKGPYGLELSDGCKNCKRRAAGFFCQISPAALKDFDAIKSTSAYPKGALLFMERQAARGVFVLCEGEVKLSISSSEGKTLIMRVAKAGEILGLMAGMSGAPYEVTAETIRPCQVAFIRREDFQRFVAKNPEASQGVARQMTMQYQAACEQLRTLGLSGSAHEKLARLLLTWSSGSHESKQGIRTTVPLTHEEIAEFIGITRETVTRTLSEFKLRKLIAIQGSTMTIPDRAALETCANL
jgi:CRP/FNR family transcriptional regulator, cyclic AMP receptor protein